MSRYLEAKLDDGSTVIGEFTRLQQVGRYVAQVFAGHKPFNIWTKVADTLPSGEAAVVRSRTMVSGKRIVSIRELDVFGNPMTEVPRGTRGRWRVPAGIEGLDEGRQFPKHRDPRSQNDYVIVEQGEEGKQKRYFIGSGTFVDFDPNAVPVLPDGDDDIEPGPGEDDDDDYDSDHDSDDDF